VEVPVEAVLDVGSNTIRLLVARVSEGNVDTVLDQSEFVRLGAGVDASGKLQPERIQAAIATIARMNVAARELGADKFIGVATSAVRDARNGGDFVRRVREETGVEIEIISGEREALLTYKGAALGISVEDGAIVCDLGGGSAEIIHANAAGIQWSVSEPLGSGRLSERFVHHDPPRAEELSELRAHVVSVLERRPHANIQSLILTGGTATHLGWLAGAEGKVQELTREDIDRVMSIVGSLPVSHVVAEYGVKPERAQVLPAGIAALQAIEEYYKPDRVVVTQHGIREGALLDRMGR
jgi:exopolyphosphatase / guanosine-5'-triphosphate,3'-diphosphate pyrophosphatase